MNLRLLQLGDSALPIGGYSHSWGLEAAIERGLVGDASTLEAWTRQYLRQVLGPLEGVVVAAVTRTGCVAEANRLLWASLSPPTLRNASRDMGEQLLSLAAAWEWAPEFLPSPLRGRGAGGEGGEGTASAAPNPLAREASDKVNSESAAPSPPAPLPRRGEGGNTQWHHAVVFASLAAEAGATPREAVALFLHQAAIGVISAGVRGVPIGHTHGQQILARLHGVIAELAENLYDKPLETAGSSCPAYEILCHEQSRLYTRIFRS